MKKCPTVYIGNLNYKITEKHLQGIFSKFGKVKSVKLLTTPGTDQSKGIAFINMGSQNDADLAIKKLDGQILDGRTVKVSIAKDNFEEAKKGLPKPTREDRMNAREDKIEKIVAKKKSRRKRGLDELFENIGKK